MNGFTCDNNSVYAYTGYCTEDQIIEVIEDGITQLMLSLDDEIVEHLDLDTRYILNVVHNKQGKPLRHSYIYFYSPEIRNAFLGYNMDGSERVEFRRKEIDLNDIKGKDWADLIEEEDAEKVILPPLITMKPVEYTDEQKNMIINSHDEYELDDIENGYVIEMMKCEVPIHSSSEEFDYKYHNIITGKIPNWVTEKILHEYFDIFNHSYAKHIVYQKPKNIAVDYPVINTYKINIKGKEQKCFSVTYDPNTADGQFAFNFRRKFCITKESRKEEVFIFCMLKPKNRNNRRN